MASEPKRRRIDREFAKGTHHWETEKKAMAARATGYLKDIEEVKNFAVAQAQEEGCKGNFRVIDSLHGNFLVPVVPNQAELSR